MQPLKLFPPVVLFALLFISFSVNRSKIFRDHKAPNTEIAGGSITCLMDGKAVTLRAQGFREISLDFYAKGSLDGIMFANGDDKAGGFQFKIKKSGITKINHTGSGDLHCIINYDNAEGVTYTGQDITVVVTSYNQHQLSGTFSGTLVNVYYKSGSAFPTVRGAQIAKNYAQFIQITNGKFDIQQ